jgi:hypothetical protein
MMGWTQCRKREWYANGGFANSKQCRIMRGKAWTYWCRN